MTKRSFLQSVAIGGAAGIPASAAGISSTGEPESPRPPVYPGAGNRGSSLIPKGHPFWPAPQLSLITDHKRHRSRGSGFVILKDKWLFFWREANIHNALDPNSTVKVAESRTAGQTLENVRTLYRTSEHSGVEWTDIRAQVMGNGRIGVYGTRRDANGRGNDRKPYFAFSDDEGKTWTPVPLDHFSAASRSPSFTFNRFPASVGGHDTDGYILFWPGSDRYMHAAVTTDNGRSWTDERLYSMENRRGGEVSVVRLGETDRWIMTGRSSRNPVYKSTDLFNWDGPYDSGKEIGSNPSGIVYNNGFITWIAASRPYHYENGARRAIPVNGSIFKGLVSATADADRIWNDPTDWPDWSVLMYSPVHYDGTFVQHQGHWYMLFGAIEGPMRIGRKYYSQLGIMSSANAPLRPFDRVLPGWMVEPEDAPHGIDGAAEYERMVH